MCMAFAYPTHFYMYENSNPPPLFFQITHPPHPQYVMTSLQVLIFWALKNQLQCSSETKTEIIIVLHPIIFWSTFYRVPVIFSFTPLFLLLALYS